MIRRIEIKNFKSLKDISLEFGNLNLLTGLNSMGKSSIIQALLVLRQSYAKGFLNERGLSLKGDLVDIGVAKEVMYEYAKVEEIRFSLHFDGCEQPFNWIFAYQTNSEIDQDNFTDSDYLPFSDDAVDANQYEDNDLGALPLFDKHLKYLNAEREVRNTYGRSYLEVNRNKNLGNHGEFTAHYLAEFGLQEIVHDELVYPGTVQKNLIAQVSAWMGEISPGTTVRAEKILGIDAIKLGFEFATDSGKTREVTPSNVGYGMTYSLPVIVALLRAEPGDIVIVENPESHVHPKGQSALGRLIALAAKRGVQLFIETHSDHVLNGVRVAVKNGVPDDIVKLFFISRVKDNGELYSSISLPKIDKDGRIDSWPENFFDEWDNNLIALL